MALGHYADLVAANERDGCFTVGLLATCPSMIGLVAGLQRSEPTREVARVGMLWVDAHADFNTPETTRRPGALPISAMRDDFGRGAADSSRLVGEGLRATCSGRFALTRDLRIVSGR
jgi:arginase family enzyme